MTEQQVEKPSVLQRIWRVLVNEFTPPPKPRQAPSEKEFAEGREAVGIIRYAISNDSPEGGLTDDDLLIHIDTSDNGQHLTLPRKVRSPLLGPFAGRRLIGKKVVVRHTTVDPNYDNDILVTRWPPEVQEALKPIRHAGPGALRARIWGILSACFFVIGYAGVMLTPVLLCDLIFGSLAGQRVLAEFLPDVHPVIALAVGIAVIPAGLFVGSVCATRRDALLAGKRTNGER